MADPLHPHDLQLIFELALDIAPYADIATRYDMTVEALEAFAAHPIVSRQIAHKRAELDRSGHLFRAKCAVMAEEGLVDLWHIFNNVETPRALRFDIHRQLVKWADLEPKQSAGPTGPGFSISINLPGQTVTIATTPTTQEPIDITPTVLDDLPDPPSYLTRTLVSVGDLEFADGD